MLFNNIRIPEEGAEEGAMKIQVRLWKSRISFSILLYDIFGIKLKFNLTLVGPLVDLLNNSVRKNSIAMKLLDFLQLLIVQLLKKFHRNILKNEGAGDNFLGLTLEKSQILKSQLSRPKEQKFSPPPVPKYPTNRHFSKYWISNFTKQTFHI